MFKNDEHIFFFNFILILVLLILKNIVKDMNIKLLYIQSSFSRTTKYHKAEVFSFINYGDMHIYMWA